ncbi:sensor histidine kinase [Subtercola sp. YIM 133946]|uniref:sensor histidine kinase n=1 Tax=Subtercola sp. YIM 133946 TaxID=3118909 RepID=UPI002F94E3E5
MRSPDTPFNRNRVIALVVVLSLVVICVVAVIGVAAARALAESEAVSDDAKTTDLVAQTLIAPAIPNALQTGDPAALATIDEVVRNHVLSPSIVRVKIWSTDGRILYSDEPRLIGRSFELGDDELEAFAGDGVRAEVSNLSAPENVYEQPGGKLLEAYRRVNLPDGHPVLFETYFEYSDVDARTAQLWGGFAAITLGSLVLLVLLLIPLFWRLISRLRREQVQREALLERALDASEAERRRIAGTLHDGVVQELVATSFTLTGLAQRTEPHDERLAGELRAVAATVRGGIGGLRTLLVDIYPPSLSIEGLAAALTDLATALRARDVEVTLDIADVASLDSDTERLVYRVAHETLANVAKHASASHVLVRLTQTPKAVELSIVDDGVGFDAGANLDAGGERHFGLRVLRDVASDAGAQLRLRTSPGHGTEWLLRVERP